MVRKPQWLVGRTASPTVAGAVQELRRTAHLFPVSSPPSDSRRRHLAGCCAMIIHEQLLGAQCWSCVTHPSSRRKPGSNGCTSALLFTRSGGAGGDTILVVAHHVRYGCGMFFSRRRGDLTRGIVRQREPPPALLTPLPPREQEKLTGKHAMTEYPNACPSPSPVPPRLRVKKTDSNYRLSQPETRRSWIPKFPEEPMKMDPGFRRDDMFFRWNGMLVRCDDMFSHALIR